MNDAFHELDKKKQLKIVNAALKVFSQSDYKHANTGEIAAIAGISKGSLFYYFNNKQALFGYLIEYTKKVVITDLGDMKIFYGMDFFEAFEKAIEIKANSMRKYPHIFSFIMRAYTSKEEIVNTMIHDMMNDYIDTDMQDYLSHLDVSKMKEGVDPQKVWDIIYYFYLGYIEVHRHTIEELDIDTILNESLVYLQILKEQFYKEEQHGSH